VRISRVAWCLAALLAAGCTPHPVGPARTFDKYEGKAVTTAESALSAVETVRVVIETAERDHGSGPYLSGVVSDQEEGLSGVQGTFGSIQPPNDKADSLMEELDGLLDDSLAHVVDVRIALRRGQLDDLGRFDPPLQDDSNSLNRFIEEHKS
jgi:hypothetical protein